MSDFEVRRFVTPDGLTLVADVGGPEGAPTVILAHGGGQTRHSWAGAMRSLVAKGYHVINYDARGHGESDWSPTADYSIEASGADLRTIIETVNGPVALVGASMGGMISFYVVGSSGETRIADAMVLVDIVINPAPEGVHHIRSFMQANPNGFANLDEVADAVAAYNPDRPRPKDPSGLMKNLRLREDGRLYWHWDPRLLASKPSVEPPEFGQRLAAVASGVKIPVLLIRGLQSDIVKDEGIAHLRSLVPHTEFCDVAGAGHMVAGDRNDAFNQGVQDFLDRNLPLKR
jgi:pimeloyl-ACP methyl ester carboxylesterase